MVEAVFPTAQTNHGEEPIHISQKEAEAKYE
jgi:hypothetical protein